MFLKIKHQKITLKKILSTISFIFLTVFVILKHNLLQKLKDFYLSLVLLGTFLAMSPYAKVLLFQYFLQHCYRPLLQDTQVLPIRCTDGQHLGEEKLSKPAMKAGLLLFHTQLCCLTYKCRFCINVFPSQIEKKAAPPCVRIIAKYCWYKRDIVH